MALIGREALLWNLTPLLLAALLLLRLPVVRNRYHCRGQKHHISGGLIVLNGVGDGRNGDDSDDGVPAVN